MRSSRRWVPQLRAPRYPQDRWLNYPVCICFSLSQGGRSSSRITPNTTGSAELCTTRYIHCRRCQRPAIRKPKEGRGEPPEGSLAGLPLAHHPAVPLCSRSSFTTLTAPMYLVRHRCCPISAGCNQGSAVADEPVICEFYPPSSFALRYPVHHTRLTTTRSESRPRTRPSRQTDAVKSRTSPS